MELSGPSNLVDDAVEDHWLIKDESRSSVAVLGLYTQKRNTLHITHYTHFSKWLCSDTSGLNFLCTRLLDFSFNSFPWWTRSKYQRAASFIIQDNVICFWKWWQHGLPVNYIRRIPRLYLIGCGASLLEVSTPFRIKKTGTLDYFTIKI